MKRIYIILKIQNQFYKFFSIFWTKNDPSFYIYNHLKDEKSPLEVFEMGHILNTRGKISTNGLEKNFLEKGNQAHLSIHPNRLYFKKRSEDGKEEHLMEEFEPQPFNKENFRLLCFLTPAPPSHLPLYNDKDDKKGGSKIAFEWNNDYCPQVSIYELGKNFNMSKANILLPRALFINSDGIHPSIALKIDNCRGDPRVWRPIYFVLGRVINKKPVTKKELEKIIKYNRLNFDISSLPEDIVITDFKLVYPEQK